MVRSQVQRQKCPPLHAGYTHYCSDTVAGCPIDFVDILRCHWASSRARCPTCSTNRSSRKGLLEAIPVDYVTPDHSSLTRNGRFCRQFEPGWCPSQDFVAIFRGFRGLFCFAFCCLLLFTHTFLHVIVNTNQSCFPPAGPANRNKHATQRFSRCWTIRKRQETCDYLSGLAPGRG